VFLYAKIGGENVMRAYTPTSKDEQLGHFDLVIKVYRRAPRRPHSRAFSKLSCFAFWILMLLRASAPHACGQIGREKGGIEARRRRALCRTPLHLPLSPPPPPIRANEHPKFPEGGKMSQHLDSLALGDEVEVKGPVGHFVYTGRGTFLLNNKPGAGVRRRGSTVRPCCFAWACV
jgi:hypothetical protein